MRTKRTKEQKLQYRKEYYEKNKEKCAAYNKEYQRVHVRGGAKMRKRKKQNCIRDRKWQEKVTESWHLTGFYIEPEEKEIDDEIKKDKLLETDIVDYYDIRVLVQDEDTTTEDYRLGYGDEGSAARYFQDINNISIKNNLE